MMILKASLILSFLLIGIKGNEQISSDNVLLDRILLQLDELETGQSQLESLLTSRGTNQSESSRHGVLVNFPDGQIFSAYLQADNCIQGRIKKWTAPINTVYGNIDRFNAPQGVFKALINGYYQFNMCMTCAEGSNCNTFLNIGGRNVIGFGDYNNAGNREQTYCQNYIGLLAKGTKVFLRESSITGSCRVSSRGFRYGSFHGFLIQEQK